jgi:uncharacterized protein YeaO (DUF488 family)
LKRVYKKPARRDGTRVLVDRLWPRGLTKEAAAVDLWLRHLAPSNELRKRYHENREAWTWEYYIQLIQVEEAFKNLKGDLGIRPIFHQLAHRIEAHIFIAFISYCLHVTLRRRLRDLAPGLTPRAVLQKFSAMQMIDVYLPTSDGRTIILSRYTQPESELKLLLNLLKLQLPDQSPPKITPAGRLAQ